MLKKLSQVSHHLDVADCMPVVVFNMLHYPYISRKLEVGSTILINVRFNFFFFFLQDFLGDIVSLSMEAYMAGCLSL